MSINLLLLGIATTISPLFVLTAVVMMSTAMRVRDAWAAVAGWMVSIGVSAAAVMLVGSALLGSRHTGPRPWWMGAIDLVIGVLLAVLAAREWHRVRSDHDPSMPEWFSRVGSMSIVPAFGIGLFLPANVLAYAAGNEIAQQHLGGTERWWALAVYVLIGSSIEAGPVLWFTLVRSSRERLLPKWNVWLSHHWQAVIATLFTVISVFLVVKGVVTIVRS